MSKEIDWSKAPQWADRVLAMGMAGAWAWANEHQYQYIGKINKEIFLYEEENTWNLSDGELVEMRHSVETWTGTGLPPIGTVCEFCGGDPDPVDPWHAGLKDGAEVSIIAHYDNYGVEVAVFTFDDCRDCISGFQVDQAVAGCFRPIRTPEQIAAEKMERAARSEAVLAMVRIWNVDPTTQEFYSAIDRAEMLYDAGYRKTEDGK